MSDRNYGIDLLRIVCMIMVCVLHIIDRGGILDATELFSLNYFITLFLKSLCFCAVDMYAIISGYVGFKSKHRICNLLSLELQAIFYSFGITIVSQILTGNFGIKSIILSVFPVLSHQWWYYSAYFVMFLFFPFINTEIRNCKRKKRFPLIIGFFTIGATVFSAWESNALFLNNGYSALWLMVLYILGSWIRQQKEENPDCIIFNPKCQLVCFIISTLITFISGPILLVLSGIIGKQSQGSLLMTYVSPFVVITSSCLVLLFSIINIKTTIIKRAVNTISGLTFGIYLIHTHNAFWTILKGRYVYVANFNSINLVAFIILSGLTFFVIGMIVEWIRKKMFIRIENRIVNFVSEKIESLMN